MLRNFSGFFGIFLGYLRDSLGFLCDLGGVFQDSLGIGGFFKDSYGFLGYFWDT